MRASKRLTVENMKVWKRKTGWDMVCPAFICKSFHSGQNKNMRLTGRPAFYSLFIYYLIYLFIYLFFYLFLKSWKSVTDSKLIVIAQTNRLQNRKELKRSKKSNDQKLWLLRFFTQSKAHFLFGRISWRDSKFQSTFCIGGIFLEEGIFFRGTLIHKFFLDSKLSICDVFLRSI